jgi:hypothetical protein
LDTELTFEDLGKSAYRGANVMDGALGQFIEAVDSGQVKKGSYLLVENLDRLSRDRIWPALNPPRYFMTPGGPSFWEFSRVERDFGGVGVADVR